MLDENLLRLPNGRLDAEANLEARKKDIEENGLGDSLEWEVTIICARYADQGYPTDDADEKTLEAFQRDFAALDSREQPNLEGANLAFDRSFRNGDSDLDLATVSDERRMELIRKYGSQDLVNDFFVVTEPPAYKIVYKAS